MSTTFDEIIDNPPSGRRIPLIVDHEEFGGAVVLQGGDVPWGDVPRLLGYLSQVHGLFDPDIAFIDGECVVGTILDGRPDLVEAMAARSRTGYALKTLLADEQLNTQVSTLIGTVGEATRRRVALQVRSPAAWLATAHERAGTPLDGVSDDSADSASVYIAEWLGRFAGLPLALVLLDGRPSGAVAASLALERLEDYSALQNTADHLRFALGWRDATTVRVSGRGDGAVVAGEFWSGGAAPDGVFLLARVPADAEPELVLARVPALA